MTKYKVQWKEILVETREAYIDAESIDEVKKVVKDLQVSGYLVDDCPAEFMKILNGSIKVNRVNEVPML